MLGRLCRFLGLEPDDGYLRDCSSILYRSPNRTRDDVDWAPPLVERVEAAIGRFPFLRGYSYG